MVKKINKVLILGSSALKIGEAGEFDYSGSQAIKALKEEGIYTILINPNIATIQTSEHLADQVYFLPITVPFVEKVIAKEKPDGILLSFGGQTALNCGIQLYKEGILEKYNVEVLGTAVQTIIDTEDRELFVNRLDEIGAKSPKSFPVQNKADAVNTAKQLGFPVMIRIAYALGGLGSGICKNEAEVEALASKAFSYTKQILIEEYLKGWKEIEYEVVRDKYDNCVTVCNMENMDPLGIHTGESIVVAPSQTLSNQEYHKLREIAIKVIRHLGIVGECNIQYALNPESEDYRIIEVNARLSRSSALASKATGYPLAFVAAKLSLGYGLHELKNSITQVTKSLFEPALDYCVVKIPRWDLKKFRKVSRKIGSGMKSVGEVMAIGRKFEEALQKALRMLDIGAKGLVGNDFEVKNIKKELQHPTDERIFAIVEALKTGMSIKQIHNLTNIEEWFLYKIKNVVDISDSLQKEFKTTKEISKQLLLTSKQLGFSDEQIAAVLGTNYESINTLRKKYKLVPAIKQIDTLAAEYPAHTNYLYLTYNGFTDDLSYEDKNFVIIIGSGAYRIGSSVEFDWCCVNAGMTLRKTGYKTIMLNYNPETVSTDYDESDVLIFDEINLETVSEIYNKFHALGVIVSMGGQIPNSIALKLSNTGINILGTSAESIDNAEDRRKFSTLLDNLGIEQPEWAELTTIKEAQSFAAKVEYPVLVRPSYVLSGAAMAVASNDSELSTYLKRAVEISSEYPIVISKFMLNAKELEFDAVAQNGEVVYYAISEHVENAGVHSGDATLLFPPQRTYIETIRQIIAIAKKIAKALMINGPFNIQLIAKQNSVRVIECNLRASRSFPFVSKVMKINLIDIATKVIMKKEIDKYEFSIFDLDHVGVKAPHFSFTRLEGADPILGVEMVSTGEVGCLGADFDEAFLKALISVGFKFPIKSMLLSTGSIESKAELLESIRSLKNQGVKLYATKGTSRFLSSHGIESEIVYWPLEKKKPNALDCLKERKVDLVLNIPKNFQEDELTNDYWIRRIAVDYNIPLITNRQLAMRLVEALSRKNIYDLEINSWSEYKGFNEIEKEI